MSASRFLGQDMNDPETIPYFTWDAPMTVAQIRERLATPPDRERLRLLGQILREARDTDVWAFTTPRYVADHLAELEPHLGRRRAFWKWLIEGWREDGLLAG